MRQIRPGRAVILPLLAALSLTAACATNRDRTATTDVAMPPPVSPGTATGTGAAAGQASQGGAGATVTPGVDTTRSGAGGSGSAGVALSPEAAQAAARQAVIAGLQSVGDRVFFETDSAALSESAQTVLRAQAAVLRANPLQRVMIAGNCDERGTREYNLALGARRAVAIRDYLVSLGVPQSQLDTVSYGKERPIDDRPNSEGWAINRNGHTFVLAGQ